MIQIMHGLPDELRTPAAALFYEAFKGKFSNVMSLDEALCVLPGLINLEQVIFASKDGKVVGFAGIQHGRKHLFTISLHAFVRCLGFLRGTFAAILISLFGRPYREGELLMDGICVDKDLRGHGIGNSLLESVCEFAKRNGYKTVRLDVVNTNDGARKLYERFGFKATVTHYHPFARPILGFSASTTMVKEV